MKNNYLIETQIINKSDINFNLFNDLCVKSKNLYNATLYEVRKYYFETGKYLNYYSISYLFAKDKQKDYISLPRKVARQTQLIIDRNFKSFFSLLKKKEKGLYDKDISIPKYLDNKSKFITIFPKDSLSKNIDFNTIILGKKTFNVTLKPRVNVKDIVQVRLVPKGNHIKIEYVYKIELPALKENNNRYCAIDLGINNLATIVSNVAEPLIINGRPIKSINQYYNKVISEEKSKLKQIANKETSIRINNLWNRRYNKIKDYFFKTSKIIMNYIDSNNINTVIIGKSDGWKQNINLGKRNNQNFVQIPYNTLICILEYKCKLKGIKVVLQEESYTSKSSFKLDGIIPTYKENDNTKYTFLGRRIKRGLYKNEDGTTINADVNGSCNILKKYKQEVGSQLTDKEIDYLIEVCSKPKLLKVTPNY